MMVLSLILSRIEGPKLESSREAWWTERTNIRRVNNSCSRSHDPEASTTLEVIVVTTNNISVLAVYCKDAAAHTHTHPPNNPLTAFAASSNSNTVASISIFTVIETPGVATAAFS